MGSEMREAVVELFHLMSWAYGLLALMGLSTFLIVASMYYELRSLRVELSWLREQVAEGPPKQKCDGALLREVSSNLNSVNGRVTTLEMLIIGPDLELGGSGDGEVLATRREGS